MMTRKELYAKVKKLHIEDAIKLKYGKNYTLVSNNDLSNFIDGFIASTKKEPKKATIKQKIEVENKPLNIESLKLKDVLDYNSKTCSQMIKDIVNGFNSKEIEHGVMLVLSNLIYLLEKKHILLSSEVNAIFSDNKL